MSVPTKFAAGTTLAFTETANGYPPSAFSLAFVLNLDGALVANIAAEASGDVFAIVEEPAQTALWKPGRYNFAEIVTETAGGAVTQLCSGQLSITPNFAATATPTPAQVTLAALDAAILKAVKTPNSIAIFNGQSFTKRNLKEMFDIRDRLRVQVDAELRAAGLSTKGGAQYLATRFHA